MQKANELSIDYQDNINISKMNDLILQKTQLEQKLFNLLQKQNSFQNYYNDGYATQFKTCLNYFEHQRLKLHQKVFDQDSSPEYFYIVLKGRIGIYSKQKLYYGQDGYQYQGNQLIKIPQNKNENQQTQITQKNSNVAQYYQVKVLGQGNQLGEYSILLNIHRCSSAIALEDQTILLRLNSKHFLQILKIREESKLFSNLTFIKESSSINFLSFNALKDIYVKSYSVRFQRDQVVCLQGAYPQAAFMIQSGEFSLCSYTHINQNKSPPKDQPYQTTLPKYHTKQDIRMTLLGIKEIFGDIEILSQQNYAYSLKCESDGEVLIIPRYIYEAKVMQNDLLIDFVKNKSSQINQKRMMLYKKFTQNVGQFRHFMYDAYDTDEEDSGKIKNDKGYEIFKKSKKFKNLVKNEKQLNQICQNLQDQNIKVKNQNYLNNLSQIKEDQNTSKQDNNHIKDVKLNNQNKMKELIFLENVNCYELSNQDNNSFYLNYKGSNKLNRSLNLSNENLNYKISQDKLDINLNENNKIYQKDIHQQQYSNNQRKLSQQDISQSNKQASLNNYKLERSSSVLQSQDVWQSQDSKQYNIIKKSQNNISQNDLSLVEKMKPSQKQDMQFRNLISQNQQLPREISQNQEFKQIMEKERNNQSICHEDSLTNKEGYLIKDGFYNQKDVLKNIFYKNHPSRPSSKVSKEIKNKCRSFSLAPEKSTIEEQEFRNYNQDLEVLSQDNSFNFSPFNSICMSRKEQEELLSQLSQRVGKDDQEQSISSPNQKSNRPKTIGNKMTSKQQKKVIKLLQEQNQELFKLKIDPKIKIKIVGYDKAQNFIGSYREDNLSQPRNNLGANQILKQLKYQPNQIQEFIQNIKEEQNNNKQKFNIGNNLQNQIWSQIQRRSKSSNTSRTRNVSFSESSQQYQGSQFVPYQNRQPQRNQEIKQGSDGFYDQLPLDMVEDSHKTPQIAVSSLNKVQVSLQQQDTGRSRFNEIRNNKPQTTIPLPRRKGVVKINNQSTNRKIVKKPIRESNSSFGTNQTQVSEIEGFEKSNNDLEVNGYDINQYRQERVKQQYSINITSSIDQTHFNSNTTGLKSITNNSDKNSYNILSTSLNTTTNGFTTNYFNTTQNGFCSNTTQADVNKSTQNINTLGLITNSYGFNTNIAEFNKNINCINKTQNDFSKQDNSVFYGSNAQINQNNRNYQNLNPQKLFLKGIETPFTSRRSTFNCISQTTGIEDKQNNNSFNNKENNISKQTDNQSINSSKQQLEKSIQTPSKKEIPTTIERKSSNTMQQTLIGNSIPLSKKEQRSSIPKQNTLRVDQYQFNQKENDQNQNNIFQQTKQTFTASNYTKARITFQKSKQSSRNNSQNSRDQSQNNNQHKDSDNNLRYISFDFRPPNSTKQHKH